MHFKITIKNIFSKNIHLLNLNITVSAYMSAKRLYTHYFGITDTKDAIYLLF